VTLYRVNLVVLLLASFLPFPTKIAGEFLGQQQPEQVAIVFYGFVLLALNLSIRVLGRYAVEDGRLVRTDADPARVASLGRPGSLVFYVVAIRVSYCFRTVGVGLYLAIALALGFPAKTIRRLIGRPVRVR